MLDLNVKQLIREWDCGEHSVLYCGKLLLHLSLYSLSCVNPIDQEKSFASTSDQSRSTCVINSVVDECCW